MQRSVALMKKIRNFTIPGFTFSGISAGIKKPGMPDLAILKSDVPSTAAGVFTTNRIKAAPVRLSRSRLARVKKCQAIVVNSGNANACTGDRGVKDARRMAAVASKAMGIPEPLICVSSTGVIGRPMPMGPVEEGIPAAAVRLSSSSLVNAARAIMTTDTFPKLASVKVEISGMKGTIAGIAKGSGMICPRMATMLCYLFTDLNIRHDALLLALREANGITFNRLTVDDDMSTNDSVIIMANGVLGNRPVSVKDRGFKKFTEALIPVCADLARMIAEDGEGATGIIKVVVEGARSAKDAEKTARAVAGSLLVKTAVYGKDPNWGRIIAATGRSGAYVKEKLTDILIGKVLVVSKGEGTGMEEKARACLGGKETVITVRLNSGHHGASILTCDLTEEYIRINAHYTT